MILNDNFHEIMDIALKCHGEYMADTHEFRAPYRYSLYAMDPIWAKRQIVPRNKLNELVAQFRTLPFRTTWSMESDEQELAAVLKSMGGQSDPGNYDIYAVRSTLIPSHELARMSRRENFYDLRIESDGTIYFYGTGERYNIRLISDPALFFKDKLARLFDISVSACPSGNDRPVPHTFSEAIKMNLDIYLDQGPFLILIGWAFLENNECMNFSKVLLVQSGSQVLSYPAETTIRPDVAEHFENRQYLYSGFKCVIKKNDIKGHTMKIGVIFLSKTTLTASGSALYGEYGDMLVV
jgi:hypothetical protein